MPVVLARSYRGRASLQSGALAPYINAAWERPPLFDLIARGGPVTETEMQRTFNLGVGNVLGYFAETNQVHDTGRREYRKTIVGIEAAENIAGKQELINLFYAVGPAPFHPVRRREIFIAALTQMGAGNALIVGSDTQRKPRARLKISLESGEVPFLRRKHPATLLRIAQR